MPLSVEEDKTQIYGGEVFFYDIGNDYIIWQSNYRIHVYSIELEESGILDTNASSPDTRRGNSAVF